MNKEKQKLKKNKISVPKQKLNVVNNDKNNKKKDWSGNLSFYYKGNRIEETKNSGDW